MPLLDEFLDGEKSVEIEWSRGTNLPNLIGFARWIQFELGFQFDEHVLVDFEGVFRIQEVVAHDRVTWKQRGVDGE